MASNLDIPKTEEQLVNQAGLLVRTVAIGEVQKIIYKGFIPKNSHEKAEQKVVKGGDSDNKYDGTIKPTERDQTPYNYRSMLNTPVMCNLILKAENYMDIEGFLGSFLEMKFDDILVDVAMQKHIIMTPVQGLNYTVKEYISDGDFALTIKGRLTGVMLQGNVAAGQSGVFPAMEMENFISLIKCPTSLEVESWYLNRMGITNIVIQYVKIPQHAGRYSTQEFEIHAYSERAIELTLR